MEENKKLFSQRAIMIATYFGGPVAAGFLLKKNYDANNQKDNGKKALVLGILSTLLLLAGIFSIPENLIDRIPNMVIPLIYTGIIYLIVEKIQGQWLKEHKENGGDFHSGWKATGIGAIFMVGILVSIMGIVFITGDLSQPDFDAATYDEEIAKFIENENASLAVFNVVNSAEPQYLIKEFRKGIVLWENNKEIVNRINSIENLPTELLDQNKKLLEYCDLRIKQNGLIVRAITEDTDKYVSEIDQLGKDINTILEELR